MRDFFSELRRRNVFRVGLTYLVVAWLVVQVVNNLIPLLGVPVWTGKAILLALIAGFPIALILAWAYELTPDGIKRSAAVSGDPASKGGFGRKWDFVIIAGLVVALGYFVWQRQSAAPPPAETARAAEPSIAVLPFQDFSPSHDQEYFSDGLSEELLNQLAHVRGLRVIGRTSSFAFKGKNEDLRKIGKTLGVDHILEGSVRKSGDELRITAQLISVADGSHLWSQTYDRTLEDVFAVQEEISRTVASALSISIGALDLDAGGTKNFDAYDAYLSGNAHQYESGPDNVLMGISDFERAVAIDPEFIQAWSGLYNLYRQAALTFGSQAREWLTKMAGAGDRVLDLAPGSPAANLVLADRAFSDRNFTEAGRLLRVIGELPSNLSQQGHLEHCLFLFGMGRARESVDCHKRMLQADPLSVIPSMNLQAGYEVIGDLDRAKTEYERALSFATDPTFVKTSVLVWAMTSGDPDEVKGTALRNPGPEPGLNEAMARLIEMPQQARSLLRKHLDESQTSGDAIGLGVVALWAAYFGDRQLALEALRTSQQQPDLYSLWNMWRPIFKDVRRLPGFKQLVRDIGISDYWRESGNWADFCHPVGDDDFECT